MSQSSKASFSLCLSFRVIIDRDSFRSEDPGLDNYVFTSHRTHRRYFLLLLPLYPSKYIYELGGFLLNCQCSPICLAYCNLNKYFSNYCNLCKIGHHLDNLLKAISCICFQVTLLAEIYGIEGNIFRLKINEETPLKPRFEVPDVLTSKPSTVR